MGSPGISEPCKGCIGQWNGIGINCSAAAAGKGISLGKYSIGSRFVFLCSDQGWFSPIGNCNHSLCCESISEERGAGNPHATFCGSRRRATASGDPVGGKLRHATATTRDMAKKWEDRGRGMLQKHGKIWPNCGQANGRSQSVKKSCILLHRPPLWLLPAPCASGRQNCS